MRKVACIFIFLTVTMMLCSQTKIWTLEECRTEQHAGE